ncbi:PDZ and LIM domain protein Zasp isoform X3 [Diachasmimorpha longicaudata]|uniref:PDZ and LIM domain protein Zasp isoform X3 n=1 Tax=Diachasmimorpha longicaudata TaxID=58733 RepID=UPI0030B8D652
MAQLISVKLSRFDGSPWGFRLQGGKDFGTPLIVQKVNNGSPAEAAGLRAGDAVIKVNNTEMFNLRHKDAQDVIVRAGNTFEVTVQRGGSTWRPSVSPVTPSIPSPQPHVPVGNVSPVTKTSLAAKKPEGPLIGSGHNFSPKPFLNGSSDGGAIKSIVNKQYNSPVGIYSEQTIAETLSAQAEVLAGGVLGVNFKKNEKNYNAQNSEVFKMVQEADKEPRSPEPIPSRTEFYSSVSKAIGGHATSPRSPTPIGRAMGYCHPALSVASSPRDDVHTTDEQLRLEQSSRASSTSDKRDRYETTFCHGCDCPIVGVFVRIKEKNLHVECFKCSTCGTSLKNVGYYNINNKLYCDIHAKLVARQQAPAGYVPITVPPGGKAPAGTISAALGNLTPCPKSPPLNGTSLAPALSTICRGTSDHGKPSRSCYRPIEFSPPTGPTEKDMIDEKTFTSTITIITGNEATNHFGIPPIDTPSFHLVQTPSSNIGGPKPFSGTKVAPPNFSTPPVSNSAVNNFNRPQSQTVTESYSECNYYEEVIGEPRSRQEETSRPPSSVKGKTLNWPPVKSLEDVTYPTASPIWIDPNPVLHRQPRQAVREKRVNLQQSCCRSQSVSRNEDCEYERELACWGEDSMDKANCNAPFYRKTETCVETRRECRASSLPRPESAESTRRSLTPTRINQPTPKPWTATVGGGAYSHVEAPQVPDPPVCTICTCRIVCEKTSGPSGPEHEQEHHYHKIVCDLCKPPTPELEPQPICLYEQEVEAVEEVVEEAENETVDLSKLVPEDVAICPKGVESQHNMYTETMEKDEGNLHIKKTTIYEKTVEIVTPERGMSPAPDSDVGRQSTTPMADREVAEFSGRQECVEAASVISSVIETNRQLDELRKQEEERRRIYEEECRREEERIRRQEEEERRREENRLRILREEKEAKAQRIEASRKQTEKCCRLEEEERKHVSFSETQRQEVQQPVNSWEQQQYRREERNDGDSSMRSQECYRSFKKEVQVQDSYKQVEEEQRQCLREQVEIHKSLRQQQPERQPSLQERRIQKRFRPQSAEEMAAVQEPVCQRKHVQFLTDSDAGICSLPQTTVKNTTPKEYKTPMCDALTTAPSRPFSPFHPGVGKTEELKHYSTEIRYQEISHQAPAPQPEYYKGPYERPVSPFTDALIIAPDRPYTPLGEEVKGVFPVDKPDGARPYTPINQQQEGYCHPAEILYTDSVTRQSRTRERSLRKVEGPRPLPTPPPDYRLRDSSISPARSLSRPTTPAECKVRSGGLKKPDTIPFYQKHLVAVEQEAVASVPYVPSRSPTPHRKSPAPGPPDPPAYYTRAQAPRIRETSQQACQRSSQQASSFSGPYEKISYHMEEDTPQGHRSSDFVGTRSSYHQDSGNESYSCQYQRREEEKRSCQEKSIEEKRSYQETSEDEAETCGISKISRTQPSLPCPISHSAISDRIQRTGVKVLPTPTMNTTCQMSETRRICHQERNTSCYSSRKEESTCANTGVTVLPCRAITDTGSSKAGVVIVPCAESESSQTCPRAGICVTPTPDRSGLCVSPALHGRSAAKCSGEKGIRSGGAEIDIGNCPASGVRVGTCTDGSVCIAPCKVPGFSSVSCPKPVQKPKCPLNKPVPFPHIPLPDEAQVDPCDVCPLKKQLDSFQPIKQQQQQPRTTLSQQLTCMTVKRDKQVVHLFKSQAEASEQCDDGLHCEPREPETNSCSDGLHCEPRKNTCSDGKHCEPETYRPEPTLSRAPYAPQPFSKTQNLADPPNLSSQPDLGSGVGGIGPQGRKFAGSSAPKRGKGILNQAATGRQPVCGHCQTYVRGPFITALGQIWCPEHFVCVNPQCRRHLQDIGFVEEKGQLYCEYCFERFIAPSCNKCNNKIKGDCLTAIGKSYHPECFNCTYCGKLFGNSPFFLEEGLPYCEADWNELFTTKCYACGFPVEAGDRWVEALNNNYHSQCFNCTMCKKNLEGQSFYAKGGRPFCKNHAR